LYWFNGVCVSVVVHHFGFGTEICMNFQHSEWFMVRLSNYIFILDVKNPSNFIETLEKLTNTVVRPKCWLWNTIVFDKNNFVILLLFRKKYWKRLDTLDTIILALSRHDKILKIFSYSWVIFYRNLKLMRVFF